GGGLHLFFQSAIEAVGATDMTYVNLGVNLPVVLPAVTNNQVDLAQVSPTATQMLRDNPDVKELMYLADNVDEYKLYGSAIGGTEKFLTERPEVAKAYCEAIGEALDYILDDDNADEVNKILADDTGITVEAAELVRQESYTKYSTDLDEDLYNETVQKYVDLGVLKPDPDPGFDNTVLIPG
ncbi:MAG: ABC transporter substrate-binding protein, partial [Acidimicrobiia bacterium]